MRLVTYRLGTAAWRAGIVVEDRVLPLAELGRAGSTGTAAAEEMTVRGVLGEGFDAAALSAAAKAADAANPRAAAPLAEVQLGPPVPAPDKIICVGLNYRDHVSEVDEGLPTTPALFPKFRNGLVGHDSEILVEPGRDVDYEGELAVVIGRRCAKVDAAAATSYLAGCTVFNDVSARDLQFRTSQWTAGKIPDRFAPCGPWLVTLDELPDLQNLRIETRLNGVTVQAASTADMVFSVADLVAYISAFVTLEPGDIIVTGTPSGVGLGQDPPSYMSPGDTVEVEIERIGTLRNQLVGSRVGGTTAAEVV